LNSISLSRTRFDAAIVDLDGTMVDNMQYHFDAWLEMAKKLGRELTRERIQRDFAGRKNEELFPLLMGRPLDAAELRDLSEEKEARYRELFAPHVRLLDGLEAFLDLLAARGIAVGIATAAPAKNREFVLERLGLAAHAAWADRSKADEALGTGGLGSFFT